VGQLYSALFNSLILPIYDLARNTERVKYRTLLEKTQWLPQEQILEIQKENLRALIKHAYETVPYYHRIFKENNITPTDIKEPKDLIKIPVLTKKDIFKYKNEMISTATPKEKLIPYMSGGTGDQITFFVTKDQISWELAAEQRGYNWAGYKLGDKCLLFWGSPIDIKKSQALLMKITSWLERVRVANTYFLSDEAMKSYLALLKDYNPEVIKGYASSVYMVSKYINENNISTIKPRTIITSAEMLFPAYRKTIEAAFSCKVFDHYGSREIGALATECEAHQGHHINAENVVMEFIRDNEPVVDESGLIYVTNLRNYGMPFIRYEIGDVGTPSKEKCICGRGLPVLGSLEGRASQFMAVYDKALEKVIPVSTAAPGLIGNLLMYVPVENYRIVQESLEKIVILVVPEKTYTQKDTDFLVSHLRDVLGDRIQVQVDKVDSIPPLPSGKRSVFISKINAFKT
jgi:phenylacetate-CoA ligase